MSRGLRILGTFRRDGHAAAVSDFKVADCQMDESHGTSDDGTQQGAFIDKRHDSNYLCLHFELPTETRGPRRIPGSGQHAHQHQRAADSASDEA